MVALLMTTYSLSYIVTCPWHQIAQLGADGGKNLYTYLYHILYDKGVWFSGFNYPYGEHIVFTDGQPLLSVPLSLLGNVSIFQALTIMWWLIAFSYILSIVYSYKILLHFKVTPFLSIFFSVLITFCSPQILRLSAHYALAYCCVILMIFYWTLQYHELKKFKYPLFIFLVGIIMTLLHPYYAAMILIWVMCYSTAYSILSKYSIKERLLHCLPMVISAIGILSVFGGIMRLTDPANDRPTTPYGILANCTTGKDILTSAYSPVWKLFVSLFKNIHLAEGGEGFAYAGATTIGIVILSFLIWIVKRNRKIISDSPFSPVFLLMSLFALLFSMGVPFVWNMEWMLDYASFLKQFRTLGRFSWIYYYIITIYSAVMLHSWYKALKNKNRAFYAYSILAIPLLIWSIEAREYIHITRHQAMSGNKNYDDFVMKDQKSWEQFLSEKHYKKEDFQAIIALPFFETGSEKLWLGGFNDRGAWTLAMGILASMQLHIPIVDAMMSRTSLSIAAKEVRIGGGPFTDKPLLRDARSNKPFLLLYIDMGAFDDMGQKYLFESSDYLGHFLKNEVYVCYPDRIRKNDKKYTDSVSRMIPYMTQNDTCIGSKGTWYINHFDKDQSPNIFFGDGAKLFSEQENITITEVPMKTTDAGKLYELSCWFLLSDEDYKSPYFTLDYVNASGKIISSGDILTKESTDNCGMWFRCFGYFHIPADCSKIVCRLMNGGKSYKAMDELLLRPADALIISKNDKSKIMANNHIVIR